MNLKDIYPLLSSTDFTAPTGFSVVLPLVEQNDELCILFEVRSAAISQGGEVCFPGGKIEPGETAWQAAVREACEELLIAPSQLEILKPMPDAYSSRAAQIHCFIGLLHDYRNTFSQAEAERVFLIPVEQLLQMEPVAGTYQLKRQFDDAFPFALLPDGQAYPFRSRRETLWFYETEEAVIWGLTAGILHHFLETIKARRTAADEKTDHPED